MLNDCFEPFKDIHKGKSAAVMGCGPTLSKYDGSKDIIHIGCNEMIYSDHLSLDYFFLGDAQRGWLSKRKTFYRDPDFYNSYKPRIGKFIRNHPQDDCNVVLNNRGYLVDHAIHYDVCDPKLTHKEFQRLRQKEFQKDICNNYMYSRMSISWEMMQFALWTGVERIYLMGHDCSYANGTLHNPNHTAYGGSPRTALVNKWGDLKMWIQKNFPNVVVQSINPVAMNHFDEVSLEDIVENNSVQ